MCLRFFFWRFPSFCGSAWRVPGPFAFIFNRLLVRLVPCFFSVGARLDRRLVRPRRAGGAGPASGRGRRQGAHAPHALPPHRTRRIIKLRRRQPGRRLGRPRRRKLLVAASPFEPVGPISGAGDGGVGPADGLEPDPGARPPPRARKTQGKKSRQNTKGKTPQSVRVARGTFVNKNAAPFTIAYCVRLARLGPREAPSPLRVCRPHGPLICSPLRIFGYF